MENTLERGPIQDRVNEALNTIRPYLEADGGDLRIVNISEEMEVTVELLGNCVSCPMSSMTMKAGIEQAILSAVPEIKSVKATNITL